MAPDTANREQPPASNNWHGDPVSVVVQLHPELLMAAKRGDWRKLEDLMSKEAASVPEFVVDVEGAGERCLSDSALHVVASGGDDSDEFLTSATVILGKAKHLLCARNAMGDTPLHCAARAGSIKMVSHLIDLARRDDGGVSRVRLALRKENKRGETALHEAVRWGDKKMVRVLMSADAELARFPRANGASPLYLAVLLEHDEIAEQLHQEDNQLSYSGPDGQNALHAAVLRSKRMTKKLLEWNENLIKQGDLSSGSTPLHVAASWRFEYFFWENLLASTAAKLLLDAHELSAYQPDGMGSFPIHAAALANNIAVARVLLRKCPDCVHLRDAQGRTFLHIAAFKGHTLAVQLVVYNLLRGKNLLNDDCQVRQRFASIMNLQDSEGNTALHLAAMAGQLWTIRRLIWHEEVRLNLQNNKGQTALDLAESRRPPWVLSILDPAIRMRRLLVLAGGRPGVPRLGQGQAPSQNGEKREEERIKDSTTTIGVVSVLILTVSFASAFQLPGGYTTGDKGEPVGTPELAMKYSFQAFVVANNLAATCSAMATICLMYAGMTTVDIRTRWYAITFSVFLVNSAARSIAAAFAFGTSAVLAPVAHVAAVITWVLTGFVMLDIAGLACTIATEQLVLLHRRGTGPLAARCNFVLLSVSVPFWVLWPYVVIAGFMVYLKVHGIH